MEHQRYSTIWPTVCASTTVRLLNWIHKGSYVEDDQPPARREVIRTIFVVMNSRRKPSYNQDSALSVTPLYGKQSNES